MPTRCQLLAGQNTTIGAGGPVLAGSELLDGSVIVSNSEVLPFSYIENDGVAGNDGAVVVWPDTGNDILQFSPGESVPAGTQIHQGSVYDNEDGQWHAAPYILSDPGPGGVAGPVTALDPNLLPPGQTVDTDADNTGLTDEEIAAKQAAQEEANKDLTKGSVPPSIETGGFCDAQGNINMPTEEELDELSKFANFEIPEFEFWKLTGFTAYITEQLAKLNAILGGISAEVDKIMDKVTFGDPDEICKPPIPQMIKKLMDTLAWVLKMMKALKKVLEIIKAIQRLVKLAKKIIMWVFAPLKLVQKFLDMLSVISLVDMVVSMLLKTVSKFMAIIPILQAELMSILAACKAASGQEPLSKEECENWIDEKDLQDLQQLYDDMVEAAGDLGAYGDDTPTGWSLVSGDGNLGAPAGKPPSTASPHTDANGDIWKWEAGGAGTSEEIGFCTVGDDNGIPFSNKQDCENNGGTWLTGESPDDLDGVDTVALAKELQKVTEELNSCFSEPELQKYLNEVSL